MSKSDCVSANWQKEGFEVGFAGKRDSVREYIKRANICAKHGLGADLVAFEAGHERGIEKYCDIPNAVKLGERGVRRAINEQICPEDDYPGFSSAFLAGYKLYDLRRQVSDIQYQIHLLQDRNYDYQRKRNNLKQRILAGNLTERSLRLAKRERRLLRREMNLINSDIFSYEQQLHEHQRAVDTYRDLLDIEYGEDR
ncbi:MAG: DUF2799 domain-containing protein [Pseudomonadota bacterium]